MSDEVVGKAVASIQPGPDDADNPNGTFEVILSDPSLDRDGESVKAEEWVQPLPEHITFDIDHGMSVASTVGSGRPELGSDGKLRVRGSYASRSLAQEVRSLVNEGHINTVSVAFLRKKDQKAGSVSRELLNGAFVAVPANPNAIVLASKAMNAEAKAGARNNASDSGRLQQIHDLAVENGAACAPMKALGDMADPDEDPGALAQAVDAAIDAVMAALQEGNVEQAMAATVAAETAADALLMAMNVPDADDATVTASLSDDNDRLIVESYLRLLDASAPL